jgi:hypothetical protein
VERAVSDNDVMTSRHTEQMTLMSKALFGDVTRHELERAAANADWWNDHPWDDNPAMATAQCVNALADALGLDLYTSLPRDDQNAFALLFTYLCPRQELLAHDTAEYLAWVQRHGGLHAVIRQAKLVLLG